MSADLATRQVSSVTPALSGRERRQLDEEGYVVLPDLLSQDECDRWCEAVDEIWEKDRAGDHDYVEEPGVQFVSNLLRYSTLFEKCVTEPKVVDAMRAVLGNAIVFSLINGRSAGPGHGAQPLHDLNRRRGRPFHWCNAIWCLDQFTPANGSTRLLPGSHLSDERFMATLTDPDLAHPDEVHIVAPRGAVVIFNSHLIHAGSRNTTDRPRRSVQSQFATEAQGSHYDWRTLPDPIKSRLGREGRALLGLD